MLMKGKNIIVTGASDGLGKQLATCFAKGGAFVILLARNEKKLKEVVDAISSVGGATRYYMCDISDHLQIERTLAEIFLNYKCIDILINNAGMLTTTELEIQDPEIITSAFKTNVIGHMFLTKGILKHMLSQKNGYIVNILSDGLFSTDVSEDYTTYLTTKAALAEYSRVLRLQLDNSQVKVIDVYPGPFASTIYDRVGKMESKHKKWMMPTEYVAEKITKELTHAEDVLKDKIVIRKN